MGDRWWHHDSPFFCLVAHDDITGWGFLIFESWDYAGGATDEQLDTLSRLHVCDDGYGYTPAEVHFEGVASTIKRKNNLTEDLLAGYAEVSNG
ncbi:MAG: hypothetical protein AAFV53_00420 [Myxococcota bacterium]